MERARKTSWMVTPNRTRIVVRSAIYIIITVMILLALYRIALLLLVALMFGIRPSFGFDLANLLEGPLYLISAIAALRRPWIAEAVSILTLAVIFARFHPWDISPFQRGLFTDYVFIVSANVVFFANIWLRRAEAKNV